ncbi:sulfatase-like hydrolase/transferase [Hujiaoplasma nucleasis]|uniref:Sulfatase-like hydrolase/transferase n=1 Tax=Hujiaoplasma nucleasis TaxID=2725268 RepID=A0A7L6N3K3_9MOLU|nr:sulfatase-like hydrolase/transferase [Hujiaoplasma nucleasis]QLY40846.1 sulfatase-like hydrolase/transferase [Hujiaoplasma nucleasis]
MKKILLLVNVVLVLLILACQEQTMTTSYITEITSIENITEEDSNEPTYASTEYNIESLYKVFPMEQMSSDLDYELTGLLDGKNLITIMLESGVSEAINPVLTPTLYQLTQEGIYFSNHYTENKTYMSEMIGILGNYPSYNFSTNSYEYDLPFSLPNIFNARGYKTVYFHENIGSFFWRDDRIPMFGFQESYFHFDFFPTEPIYGWGGDYTLDSRTMDAMMPYMFNEEENQPFYYFWTTLVTHGPYNRNYPSDRGMNNLKKFIQLGYFDLIDQAKENGQWINPLDSIGEEAAGQFRFYQAAMMDFDIALNKLITQLTEKELIDDTLILIYGDHAFYHDGINELMLEATNPNAHEKEMYQTFFVLYNPELSEIYMNYHDSHQNDKFINPYDIAPTLYQLFNIAYYEEFIHGHSVFSSEESIFYSHKLDAYFNDDFYTVSLDKVDYSNIDIDPELSIEFLEQVNIFYEKQAFFDAWIYSHKTKRD